MKKYILLSFLVILTHFNLFADEGLINAVNVNIRILPSKDANVLVQLNKGDKINIISIDQNFIVINNYVGRWCKIKYKDSFGYVLSCFVISNSIKEDSFHSYLNELKNDIENKKLDSSKFIFPIEHSYGEMGNDHVEIKYIDEKTLKLQDISFMNSKYATHKNIYINKSVIAYDNCEGDGCATYYFKLTNNKWKMFKISISN